MGLSTENAAVIFATAASIVVAFQLALALGAPWGAYAMAGRFPGTYPPRMRVVAVLQAMVLLSMALVVLSRAGLVLPRWAGPSKWLVWAVVALSAVSVVLNLVTPSAGERRVWAPVAIVLLVSSLIVALTPMSG